MQTSRRPRAVSRRMRNNNSRGVGGTSSLTTSGSNSRVSLPKTTYCEIPRSVVAFPDVYTAWFKTTVENGFSGSVASQNTYHLNSPAFTFGPQVNWTGAFANNYPSGMSYLLGTPSAGGSTAPYALASTIEYDWQVDLVNIASVAAYVTLIPAYSISLTGMSQATLAEQRGALQILVPPNNTAQPLKLRSSGKISELFGTTAGEVLNNQLSYAQAVGALPLYSVYMHLIVSSVDGSTSCAMQTKSTVWLKIRYSRNNPYTTSPPT